MKETSETPTVFIGVGNDFRGDDGAGPFIARSLREKAMPGLLIRESQGDTAELLEYWSSAEQVIVADAVHSGAPPGTIHVLDALREKLPCDMPGSSTHGLSLERALALSRVLGNAPANLKFYGIEGENFDSGTGLTPCIREACVKVMEMINLEIKHNSRPGSGATEQNNA